MAALTYAITGPLALYYLFRYLQSLVEDYRLEKLAQSQGCAPVKQLPVYLPFGIDRLARLMYASSQNRHIEFITARYQESPTHRIAVLGNKFIVTHQSENIKAMLATQFPDFSLGYRKSMFQEFLGDGIFNADGEIWEHSRALLRPQFVRNQISDLKSLEDKVQKFLGLIPKNGETFDIQELCLKLMTDTATENLFGQSINSLDNDEVRFPGDKYSFAEAFNRAQSWIMFRFRFQGFAKYVNPKDSTECVRICHSFVDKLVADCLEKRQQRLAEGKSEEKGKYVFLEALAEETQDRIILRDQLMNLLLAGRDTTGAMLSFTFRSLAEHPAIFNKLRRTIIEHFGYGTDKISFESLKACEYLRYFMNEVLRLYPSVPFNGRMAVRDTTLPVGGGPNYDQPIFIKKGMRIDYNVYSLHRRKDIWGEDADEFKPERWDPKSRHKRPGAWDYIPFNGGPRICLGQQYALTTAAYTIVRTLQRLESIEVAPDAKFAFAASIILFHAHGTNIRVKWDPAVKC